MTINDEEALRALRSSLWKKCIANLSNVLGGAFNSATFIVALATMSRWVLASFLILHTAIFVWFIYDLGRQADRENAEIDRLLAQFKKYTRDS